MTPIARERWILQAQPEDSTARVVAAGGARRMTARSTPDHARRFERGGLLRPRRRRAVATISRPCGARCDRLVGDRDREMDRLGVDVLDLDHRGRRYFLHAYERLRRRSGASCVSDLMAEVARTALGETVHLFNEQYVVKAAERGMQFGWHQDSGFIAVPARAVPHVLDPARRRQRGQRHRPPAALRPGRHPRGRPARPRRADQRHGRLHRRRPRRPGDRRRAGSIVCFSSTLLHRSGPNTTDNMRRVYVAQYSAEPLLDEEGARTAPPRRAVADRRSLRSGCVQGRGCAGSRGTTDPRQRRQEAASRPAVQGSRRVPRSRRSQPASPTGSAAPVQCPAARRRSIR